MIFPRIWKNLLISKEIFTDQKWPFAYIANGHFNTLSILATRVFIYALFLCFLRNKLHHFSTKEV